MDMEYLAIIILMFSICSDIKRTMALDFTFFLLISPYFILILYVLLGVTHTEHPSSIIDTEETSIRGKCIKLSL